MVEADSFKFFCFQSITGTKFMCQADIKMRMVFIFFLLVPNYGPHFMDHKLWSSAPEFGNITSELK